MTNDKALDELAVAAGIATQWTDVFNASHDVTPEAKRALLDALNLPHADARQMKESLARLSEQNRRARMVIAAPGSVIELDGAASAFLEMRIEGQTHKLTVESAGGRLRFIAPQRVGYGSVRLSGREVTIALAPERAPSVKDLTGRARAFGAAVQVYQLNERGQAFGDFGDVARAAETLAKLGAQALAVSPVHAGFHHHPERASPYAPSSRALINALFADPQSLFDKNAGSTDTAGLIDWSQAGGAKYALLRQLYDDLPSHPEAQRRFHAFSEAAPRDIANHAVFEAIHAEQANDGRGDWRAWPQGLRRPDGPEVAAFRDRNPDAVGYHTFLQWLAHEGLDQAQARARAAGMGIGLIADLAVGIDGAGSDAWGRQDEMLEGLSIGAPPDLLNRRGQDWGLAAFSPVALRTSGYDGFLANMRAALRHAGGLRIDHILGLQRLWLVPKGLGAKNGAYLRYPLDDLLALIALEAHLARALVIGEDLGTVPEGFRDKLVARGILGMRVLRFERARDEGFIAPSHWQKDGVAMTSTHDLAPLAGWWTGRDLQWQAGFAGADAPTREAIDERRHECQRFWSSAVHAGVAREPMPAIDDPQPAVDASIDYALAAGCDLTLTPIEDILGLEEAPNMPGTIDEHPNWRRRLPASLATLLAKPLVTDRLDRMRRAVAE